MLTTTLPHNARGPQVYAYIDPEINHLNVWSFCGSPMESLGFINTLKHFKNPWHLHSPRANPVNPHEMRGTNMDDEMPWMPQRINHVDDDIDHMDALCS